MFNRLWSLLYYSGEHADGGPIERMDVGRNQAVILLTGHAGRAVVLYRDGSAVRFFHYYCREIAPARDSRFG